MQEIIKRFTSGPWYYNPTDFNTANRVNAGSIKSKSDGDEWYVAEICGDLDEHLHNAALISCAPEMFELLGKILGLDLPDYARTEIKSLLTKATTI